MKNPALTSAIVNILARLDPVPLLVDTLSSEVDLALAEPVTTTAFREALADLGRRGITATGRDPLLGVETVGLTAKGRRLAQ